MIDWLDMKIEAWRDIRRLKREVLYWLRRAEWCESVGRGASEECLDHIASAMRATRKWREIEEETA